MEQGLCADANDGVQAAELTASGSGSPVFLIHADVLSGGRRGNEVFPCVFVETRMLSQPEHERRVTGSTKKTGIRDQGSGTRHAP
jgi:hypothetical protein